MTPDPDLLRRFLLGELSDEQHASLQETIFLDERLHARVLAAEDDLFDAHARGELTAEERTRFEARFGHDRQRSVFARLLAQKRM
jgi:anti-sigma factor RsiW